MSKKFKDFLKELKIKNLKQNSSIDIRDLNRQILSHNHEKNIEEYKRINKIIRKKNGILIFVKTENNIIECTIDHKFYTNNNTYESVEDILENGFHNYYIQNKGNNLEKIMDIELTEKKIPIYDLEVEDNHNLFTNNLLSHNSMGDPTCVSGGKAIPFYAHVRIRITRSEIDRENQQNVMKFTVIKNKLAPPFKVGTIIYNWETGFDLFSEIGELAIEFDIIKKVGNTYHFPQTNDTQVGKKKTIQYLKDNQDYMKNVLEPLVKDYLSHTNLRKEDLTEEIMN